MLRLILLFCLIVPILAFASDESCTNLSLTCISFDSHGNVIAKQKASFVDENWDEPSLKNCASTVYLNIQKNSSKMAEGTTIRVRAAKDNILGNILSLEAVGIQIFDIKEDNGEIIRNAFYSNTIGAKMTIGESIDLGVIHLAKPIHQDIQDLSLKCIVINN